MSEYDFYQIDATGVSESDRDDYTRTDISTTIRRASDSKISLFGTNNVGARRASDYTKTALDFQSKDELADYAVQTADTGMGQNVSGRGITIIHNPYVLGSTVKKVRDDQFFRMTMSNDRGASIDAPKFDVMDTNLVDASDMVAGKNWPTEGWRSYGGKYDFSYVSYTNVSGSLVREDDVPYQGGGIH